MAVCSHHAHPTQRVADDPSFVRLLTSDRTVPKCHVGGNLDTKSFTRCSMSSSLCLGACAAASAARLLHNAEPLPVCGIHIRIVAARPGATGLRVVEYSEAVLRPEPAELFSTLILLPARCGLLPAASQGQRRRPSERPLTSLVFPASSLHPPQQIMHYRNVAAFQSALRSWRLADTKRYYIDCRILANHSSVQNPVFNEDNA
jgi:hypothetical protein